MLWTVKICEDDFWIAQRFWNIQWPMDEIISLVRCQYALVYVNDNIMFWGFANEHTLHVRAVLPWVQIAGITLGLKNDKLSTENCNHVRHMIQAKQIGNEWQYYQSSSRFESTAWCYRVETIPPLNQRIRAISNEFSSQSCTSKVVPQKGNQRYFILLGRGSTTH